MARENKNAPELLSDALIEATGLLGDNERVRTMFAWAGMPSEYRSGLVAAREQAATFLRKRRSAKLKDDDRLELASRIIEVCHAVVFTMRHSLDVTLVIETAARDISHMTEALRSDAIQRVPQPPTLAACRLEDLEPNASVRGVLPNELVTVVSVKWHSSDVLELIYKTVESNVADVLLYRGDEPRLEIVRA
jgi:hypothetical protein